LQALSKQVKVLRKFNQQLSAGLDESFVLSEAPEGHFTATFILANARLSGQQVFWNGSGTGKYRDFRSILTISRTVLFSVTLQFSNPNAQQACWYRPSPAMQNGSMTVAHRFVATRPVH
jgi:hypothetical protein